MTTIGRIIDLSSNNHPGGDPINWGLVRAAGVTTAIIKATEGTTYVNPWYERDMDGAQEAEIDVLAYHFASFTDAGDEAEFFVATAGVRWARVLDIETSTNTAWARSFLSALDLDPTARCTYGSASTLGSIRAQVPSTTWCAAYNQGYPGWGVMWQFTPSADIPGIPGLCDESSWHGTGVQYDDLFGLTDPPPVVPPPLPEGITDDMITRVWNPKTEAMETAYITADGGVCVISTSQATGKLVYNLYTAPDFMENGTAPSAAT